MFWVNVHYCYNLVTSKHDFEKYIRLRCVYLPVAYDGYYNTEFTFAVVQMCHDCYLYNVQNFTVIAESNTRKVGSFLSSYEKWESIDVISEIFFSAVAEADICLEASFAY
jgi:hypothetical protein